VDRVLPFEDASQSHYTFISNATMAEQLFSPENSALGEQRGSFRRKLEVTQHSSENFYPYEYSFTSDTFSVHAHRAVRGTPTHEIQHVHKAIPVSFIKYCLPAQY